MRGSIANAPRRLRPSIRKRPPNRSLARSEKATRLDRVKTALGASDPTVVVDALAADSNVLFIIEKRVCHDDV